MEAPDMDNSPSETYSISTTSKRDNDDDVLNLEHQTNMKKMKEKDQTFDGADHHEGSNPNNSLTSLNSMDLSIDDSVYGRSMVEFDFFNSRNDIISDSSNVDTKENTSETRTFSCNFGKREFSSSQALGGHQNAHKHERAIAKRRQGMDPIGVLGHPHHHHFSYYYPYPGISTNTLYSACYNRGSYPNWSNLNYGTRWLQGGSSSGVGIMRSGASNLRMIENGDSSSANNNVVSPNSTTMDKSIMKGGKLDDHPKQEDKSSSSEHSEIDLTLKL